ncbi:MAG: FtsW/RodA/SpoVE family cell cycle protein [Lachnospira eligens]
MCMLMSVGFIMIARLNYDKCVKQFVIAVLGTVIMFLVPWLIKSVKSFRNFGWIYCVAGLVLLCAVLLGNKVYGANLTLSIGAFSVQPAEFVRFCMLCLLLRCLISQQHLNRHVLLRYLQHFMLLYLCFQRTLVRHLYFCSIYRNALYSNKKAFICRGRAACRSGCICYCI